MGSTYWTIALQAINFLVLVWLLQRFLYRPVLAVIERRRAISEHALAEAAQAMQATEEMRHTLDQERVTMVAERDQLLEKAATECERERDGLLEKARNEAQALEAQTRRQLEHERAVFSETIIAEAAKLAIEIASRLLASAKPANPIEPFLERAAAAIAAMPASERDRLLSPGEPLTLVSALALDENQRAIATARLGVALGRPVSPSFEQAADLIQGIELRFPRAVLRHNWRDDLAAALKEMTLHERSATNA